MPPLTRPEALARLDLERTLYPGKTRMYLSIRPLRSGDLRLALGEVEPEHGPHPDGSWVALLDPQPSESWPHKATYLLLDPNGDLRSFDARWFPHAWKLDFRAENAGGAS